MVHAIHVTKLTPPGSECNPIYGWCRASDAIIKKLCHEGKWALLEHLNMSDCAVLTDVSIRALAASCPKLASLDASGAGGNISGEALHTLGDRLTAVRLDRLRPRAVSGASVGLALFTPCNQSDTQGWRFYVNTPIDDSQCVTNLTPPGSDKPKSRAPLRSSPAC